MCFAYFCPHYTSNLSNRFNSLIIHSARTIIIRTHAYLMLNFKQEIRTVIGFTGQRLPSIPQEPWPKSE